MKTRIDITKLLKQIDAFGDDAKRMAVAITNSTAEDISNKAKIRVTNFTGGSSGPIDLRSVNDAVDYGQLRQSIGKTTARLNFNKSVIFANAPYSPFVNWGTGGLVNVEAVFKDYAITFKGKGIKKINLPARPFLTGSYLEEAAIYPEKLKTFLNRLTNQYNAKK